MTVTERLDALARAVLAGRDVLPADVVTRAQQVEERAGHRLRLSADHTVVAFAGATGSGKSSLVNALVGEALAEVDVLRPTTSEALAVVRGQAGSAPLLDWLGVRRRHQLTPGGGGGGIAGGAAGESGEQLDAVTDGLVLLDLPDHDSVRTEHRLEAERLIALVDLMVWVVDPQKYADAVIHERYLRGLGGHRDVMLIVLNQVDRLSETERAACHRDLERLLADDGLAGVPVLDVSARTGEGVPTLRDALDDAARRRVAAQARVEADVTGLAQEIQDACGTSAPGASRAARQELVEALGGAAGIPAIAEAVRSARVLHARRATGWPPTRWLSRFRSDPLRRLHLGTGTPPSGRRDDRTLPELVRTSVPRPGAAELARVRAAVRSYADEATSGAPDAWVLAARGRLEAADESAELADALDRAVSGTHVISTRRPVWWTVVGALQWLLLAVLIGGLLWLGALAGLDALRMPSPEPPLWGDVPVPTAAAIGGAVLGLLAAAVSRVAAGIGGRRQARRATARLREAVAVVADSRVVAPVDGVLERLQECRRAADVAAGPSGGRGSRRTATARRGSR